MHIQQEKFALHYLSVEVAVHIRLPISANHLMCMGAFRLSPNCRCRGRDKSGNWILTCLSFGFCCQRFQLNPLSPFRTYACSAETSVQMYEGIRLLSTMFRHTVEKGHVRPVLINLLYIFID